VPFPVETRRGETDLARLTITGSSKPSSISFA
jgi:hypothetical protein